MRHYIGNASNRSSATPDNNIFARLYKEAEERERQYQVQRMHVCMRVQWHPLTHKTHR